MNDLAATLSIIAIALVSLYFGYQEGKLSGFREGFSKGYKVGKNTDNLLDERKEDKGG